MDFQDSREDFKMGQEKIQGFQTPFGAMNMIITMAKYPKFTYNPINNS